MNIIQDLKFIESALQIVVDSLTHDDEKLAESCIRSIQNYLNGTHHPLCFFSIVYLIEGNKN